MNFLTERRDKLRTEIEVLKARLEEVDGAINLMRGEALVPDGSVQSRTSFREAVLDLVADAGSVGIRVMDCAMALDVTRGYIVNRENLRYLLRVMTDDGTVVLGSDGCYRANPRATP